MPSHQGSVRARPLAVGHPAGAELGGTRAVCGVPVVDALVAPIAGFPDRFSLARPAYLFIVVAPARQLVDTPAEAARAGCVELRPAGGRRAPLLPGSRTAPQLLICLAQKRQAAVRPNLRRLELKINSFFGVKIHPGVVLTCVIGEQVLYLTRIGNSLSTLHPISTQENPSVTNNPGQSQD
jgi:hypothetical protein